MKSSSYVLLWHIINLLNANGPQWWAEQKIHVILKATTNGLHKDNNFCPDDGIISICIHVYDESVS